MCENEWITAPSGADHHERFDGDVAAELGIGCEKDRLGRDQRHAGVEGGLAQPGLHHGFRFGELRLVVVVRHLIPASPCHEILQKLLAILTPDT
jgi:hypothetical protein